MGRRSNYTAKQKAEVVLSVLSKQTTIAEACRRHGITETTFARWREQAVTAMEKGLEDRGGGASGREAELEREIAVLARKLGQLAVIADLRGKALRRLGRWAKMPGRRQLLARSLVQSFQREARQSFPAVLSPVKMDGVVQGTPLQTPRPRRRAHSSSEGQR
jgi:transposase